MADFKYDGPNGGNAASDDEQFRTSGNQYAQGLKPRATAQPTDTGFNQGSPLGYYTNRPSDASNLYSGGGPMSSDDASLSSGVAEGFASLYGDVRSSRQPMDSPDPGAAGEWNDEGFGKSGMGRS